MTCEIKFAQPFTVPLGAPFSQPHLHDGLDGLRGEVPSSHRVSVGKHCTVCSAKKGGACSTDEDRQPSVCTINFD